VQKDTVTINVDFPVGLSVSDNKILCIGQKVQLLTTGKAASYLWSPAAGLDDITTASPIASPSVSTTYRVIAFSNNACKNDTGYVLVAVGNIPLVNAGDDKTIAAGTQVQLSATVNSNDVNKYLWTPSSGLSCTACPDPTFTADKDIRYKLTVQTTYGCTASDEVNIFVFCNKGKVFIPDAFTPNNDGLNDRFYVKGYGLSKVKSLLIFNRWGQKVFEKQNIPVNDANHGWDGLVNGLPAEPAAFVYLLNVICDDGNEFSLKGTVLLIK
jgi:gliding motility-associated-like protein